MQLDGKLVEPKVAVPRKTNPKLVMRTRKIFVGGLSATTSIEDIKNYFEQFSKVSVLRIWNLYSILDKIKKMTEPPI